MDMNISMRDKKILLMFFGVGIFAVGYFFGYRPQMEEAESIQASNAPLQERLNDLLKLAENKDFYLEETDSINAKIDEYTSEFPADRALHEYGEFPGYADFQCGTWNQRVYCGS